MALKNSKSRREFIKQSSQASLGLGLLGGGIMSYSTKIYAQNKLGLYATNQLKILILGGTSFLGPHQIAYALKRGHQVTTFTRGKTQPRIHSELFADVEALIGDRENNLTALENRTWDVVIDNSGRKVEWTKKAAELLKDKANHYIYTSSTGVYYPYLKNKIDENTTLLLKEPEVIEDEDMKMEYWYGVMKSNSEIAARRAFGEDRTLVIRPTYMLGPGDKYDRFTYWPLKFAQGGPILVPGKSDDPVQYIDVRDVAEWTIRMIEQKAHGAFNAVGPDMAETLSQFAQKASTVFNKSSELININDYEFLKSNKLPYLIPWVMPEGNNFGTARISNKKSKEHGLTFRGLDLTMKDFYKWWQSEAVTQERKDQFLKSVESIFNRDQAIIKLWKERN